MLENPSANLFLYVVVGAAVAMALLWYFVIAPIEKRNHERKLAILQEKIKKHEAEKAGGQKAASDGDDAQN